MIENDFTDEVISLSNEELKHIVININQYRGALIAAAKHELVNRGIELTVAEKQKIEEIKVRRPSFLYALKNSQIPEIFSAPSGRSITALPFLRITPMPDYAIQVASPAHPFKNYKTRFMFARVCKFIGLTKIDYFFSDISSALFYVIRGKFFNYLKLITRRSR